MVLDRDKQCRTEAKTKEMLKGSKRKWCCRKMDRESVGVARVLEV